MLVEDNDVNMEIAHFFLEELGFQIISAKNGKEALELFQKEPENTFDFIFMDAAKGQYIHYLPNVLRLLSDGGCLVSDNVMQDGDIIESRFAVERRNRTIHARMREYLYELKHREDLVTSIIPLGDGVAVSIKQGVEK